MRKMITTLNAMLRDGTTWVDRYGHSAQRVDRTVAVALSDLAKSRP